MFKLFIIVISSVLLSACMARSPIAGNLLNHRKYAGGWQALSRDQEALELAKFATRDLPEDSVLKVIDARVQNILGTCYMLAFQMCSGQNLQAELYRDIDGKLTLLELSVRE